MNDRDDTPADVAGIFTLIALVLFGLSLVAKYDADMTDRCASDGGVWTRSRFGHFMHCVEVPR